MKVIKAIKSASKNTMTAIKTYSDLNKFIKQARKYKDSPSKRHTDEIIDKCINDAKAHKASCKKCINLPALLLKKRDDRKEIINTMCNATFWVNRLNAEKETKDPSTPNAPTKKRHLRIDEKIETANGDITLKEEDCHSFLTQEAINSMNSEKSIFSQGIMHSVPSTPSFINQTQSPDIAFSPASKFNTRVSFISTHNIIDTTDNNLIPRSKSLGPN